MPISPDRIAILHYWLKARRGGEAVLREIARLCPAAPIYTHAYVPEAADPFFREREVRETFIARLPAGRRKTQAYLPLMPRASRSLDLDAFDAIISSESGPIKGIRKRPGQIHLCYCHSPMRYVWDLYDEYRRAAGPAARLAMRFFRDALRKSDIASAGTVDHFAVNSHFVAERVRRIYGREARVIPPPVDVDRFATATKETGAEERGYYLFVGELLPYKRPDLAVAACSRLGRGLVVVGGGPMRRDLEKQAAGAPRVRFAGPVDDAALAELYAGARALLFPGIEDFGMVAVEAQAAGTPVVALAQGGARETVIHAETGCWYGGDTVNDLIDGMLAFEAMSLDEATIRAQARQFDVAHFRRRFTAFLRDAGLPVAE